MPRPLRIIAAGQPLHLMQRGNNRCKTFTERAEFLHYLRLVGEAATEFRCSVHAYVLMSNHTHLLVTPSSADGPPRLMKAVSEKYARYYNDRHERTGTLWEGRYRSAEIDDTEYFFECSRYIELNAFRAGMVRRPEDYRWSSYAQNAGDDRKTLITPHPLYMGLAKTEAGRREAYRAMFKEVIDQTKLEFIRRSISRPANGRRNPKRGTDEAPPEGA